MLFGTNFCPLIGRKSSPDLYLRWFTPPGKTFIQACVTLLSSSMPENWYMHWSSFDWISDYFSKFSVSMKLYFALVIYVISAGRWILRFHNWLVEFHWLVLFLGLTKLKISGLVYLYCSFLPLRVELLILFCTKLLCFWLKSKIYLCVRICRFTMLIAIDQLIPLYIFQPQEIIFIDQLFHKEHENCSIIEMGFQHAF